MVKKYRTSHTWVVQLEAWPSGLRQLPEKQQIGESRSEGSNPSAK